MISQQEFEALAERRAEDVVSIHLPTHRRGPDVEQNAIRFKNLLREIERRAQTRGMDVKTVERRLDQLKRRLDDSHFWSHQGDGLAVFVIDDQTIEHRLPVAVKELTHIGDRPIVRPMLPAIAGRASFYVLALSQNQVRVAICTESGARELDLHDIPESLHDAVGYDWEQKSLQFHTGASTAGGGQRAAVFHGHGAGGDEDKDELEQFLRAVDDGLGRLLEPRRAPVVIAAEESVGAHFRRISRLPQLTERMISGNPDHLSLDELHERAMKLMRSRLEESRRSAVARLMEESHRSEFFTGLEEALPALRDRSVGAIAVHADHPVWGRFDSESSEVAIHDDRAEGDDDLLDLAVSLAVMGGVTIQTANEEEIPGGVIAGLRRY